MSEEAKLRVLATRLVDQVSHLCMIVNKLQSDMSILMDENDDLKRDIRRLKEDLPSVTLLTTTSPPPCATIEEIVIDSYQHPTHLHHHFLQSPTPSLSSLIFDSSCSDPLSLLSTPPSEIVIAKDFDFDYDTVSTTTSTSTSSDYLMTDVFECLDYPIIEIESPDQIIPIPIPISISPVPIPIPIIKIIPKPSNRSPPTSTASGTDTTHSKTSYTTPNVNIIRSYNARKAVRRVSGSLKILVVEDDPVCQQLISHIVKSLHIGQVEVVSDGVEAVINMTTGSFDLILMDMQLPRLDGLQATQNIRKFNRRTPIVSMTARVGADDIKRYYEGGIDDVLPKPFDKHSVQRIIKQFFKLSLNDDIDSMCTCDHNHDTDT